MEKSFVDIKKIVGNKYKAGIYVFSNDYAVQLLDINNRVVVNLKLREKIDLFNIILNKMINGGLNEDIMNLEKLFDYIMDAKEREMENLVNELFHKVIFLYSKPNIDIREVLSIADLVSNRLYDYNNDDIKSELGYKIHYV